MINMSYAKTSGIYQSIQKIDETNYNNTKKIFPSIAKANKFKIKMNNIIIEISETEKDKKYNNMVASLLKKGIKLWNNSPNSMQTVFYPFQFSKFRFLLVLHLIIIMLQTVYLALPVY